jgi:hypothetical protein
MLPPTGLRKKGGKEAVCQAPHASKMKPSASQRRRRKGIASGIDMKREGARGGKRMSHGRRPI